MFETVAVVADVRRRRTAILCLFCWVIAGYASAAEQPSRGALSVILENDIITSSDNNYTNGIGVSWSTSEIVGGDDGFPGKWADWWSFLPGLGDADSQTYASWTLGQEVHTPDDITNPRPPLDDQPYAGVLYVDNVLYARKQRSSQAWSLRIGIVGPSSQADSVQMEIHRYLGGDVPRGWRNQLPDEPIINVGYTAGHVWIRRDLDGTAAWRVVPLVSVDLGTYITALGGGVVAEVGWNLADALGVSGLRYRLDAAPTIGAGPVRGWSLVLFGGLGGGAVAHYLPLDGTVFRSSRSVRSNPFVGIGTVGVSLRHEQFTLGVSTTFFTERFDSERQRADFGTVTFSWYF